MSGTNENARHPDSTFKTDYPYNQATVTRSGHEFHINDAPGKESLKLAHTTGTYVEIESTGRWVQVVTEKCYKYITSTFTTTVDSHMDTKVGGTHTLNIDKSAYENVALDKTVGIGGDLIHAVGGVSQYHTEKDKMESVNGSDYFYVKGDRHQTVDGAKVTEVTDVKSDILQNDWSVTSKGAVDMQVDGDFRVTCKNFIVSAAENIAMYAAGSVTITTGAGPITITAAGIVYVNGVQIRLNG